ncbi:MAG: hypothetical protein JNN03_23525 [Rubrivivax sp.]|nr:hypothetical protein [Rubrivivax sp.]
MKVLAKSSQSCGAARRKAALPPTSDQRNGITSKQRGRVREQQALHDEERREGGCRLVDGSEEEPVVRHAGPGPHQRQAGVDAARRPRPKAKRPWPASLAEQIKAVAEVMAGAGRPLAMTDLEARFAGRGRWRERLPVIVETLVALGRMRAVNEPASAWEAA